MYAIRILRQTDYSITENVSLQFYCESGFAIHRSDAAQKEITVGLNKCFQNSLTFGFTACWISECDSSQTAEHSLVRAAAPNGRSQESRNGSPCFPHR